MATLFLLLFAATLPAGASAGTFTVSSCRTPAGAPAPIDGWRETLRPPTYGGMSNGCANGGAFSVSFDNTVPHQNQEHARMEFRPDAPGLVLRSASLWRWTGIQASQQYTTLVGYISAPTPDYGASVVDNQYGAGDRGSPYTPVAEGNRVDIPASSAGTPGSVIGATVACASQLPADHPCTATGSVNIFAAQIQLDDTAAPVVSSATGDLLADRGTIAPALSGTKSVVVQASDVGSGLVRAVVVVDGKDVVAGSYGDNAGRCVAVGPKNYVWRQPCAASGSAAITFDTTKVADGSHQVQVVAEDASGGRSVAATGTVTIKNSAEVGPSSPPALRGEPNGSPAVDEAQLALSFPQTAKAPSTRPSVVKRCAANASYRAKNAVRCNGLTAKDTITATWSKSKTHVLAGRLTTTSGAPIAGATVEVSATSLAQGAGPVALADVTTDADGRFSMPVARASGSMTIQARWRARRNDTNPVAAASAISTVRASTGLTAPSRVKPRAKVTFSGTLRGKTGSLAGVPVSLQSRNNGKWQTFETVSTDAAGKWRKRLTFASAPGNYRVRAKVGTVATYPWAEGYSAGWVTVRVRR